MTIDTAMVLAAGLGKRIRAVADDRPKPLVEVAGKPLIDWTLDLLQDGGIRRAVVNVHHMADMIEAHLANRDDVHIAISDERERLMETGGGLMQATPLLGTGPVFCSNTDAILLPESRNPAELLRECWDPARMDALLLLVPTARTSGYAGQGDFLPGPDGRLSWDGEGDRLVFTGLQIIDPRLWSGEAPTPQSTRVFWDRAMAAGRLHGVVFDGDWMHVGDPEGHAAAAERLARG
jgi:MurNAc alpha-1-phosphate uridylyltransferase